MKRIEEVLQKLENTTHSVLRLVQEDNDKFGDEIHQKYHMNIQIIEDKYIGGCILEDETHGLYIDHTIQNSIDERVENELR